jgi:hypothetical protein
VSGLCLGAGLLPREKNCPHGNRSLIKYKFPMIPHASKCEIDGNCRKKTRQVSSNICSVKQIMSSIAALLLFVGLVGCSDPVEQLRRAAINSFPEFWEQPAQLAMLRKVHNIPESYSFNRLELIGAATDRDQDYGLYEWAFQFGEDYTDMIEIRMVCYFDTDTVVMHDVKTERIRWKDLQVVSKTFSFRGIDND